MNSRLSGVHLSATVLRGSQILLTVLLYTAPAFMALHGAVVGDPDVWWHLRTGEWIAEHHAVPRTDVFTTFGAGRPWAAYSWIFELILFGLYRYLGLYGIVLYTSVMMLGITVALYRLIQRFSGPTPAAILLTFIACFSMGHLYTPRPWLITIFLFTIELDAVFRFRETRSLRCILPLPFIFALWANVHIQFIDGLIVLAFACLDELYTTVQQHRTVSASSRKFFLVTLLCFLATLANPYGFAIYRVAHDLAAQAGVMNSVQELQSMPFRDAVDWSVLALGVSSIVALARRSCTSLFGYLLLVFAMVLGFRSQRDVWVLAIVSAATLASTVRRTHQKVDSYCHYCSLFPLGATLLLLFAVSSHFRVANRHLKDTLATSLPVNAAKYVREAKYPGPIFNDYGWGGYLMWSLRKPVCIDGRAALQGDARIAASLATWGGSPSWTQNPDLSSANLVFGPRNAPLSQLLRQSRDFHLVYEDNMAAVFARSHVLHTGP